MVDSVWSMFTFLLRNEYKLCSTVWFSLMGEFLQLRQFIHLIVYWIRECLRFAHVPSPPDRIDVQIDCKKNENQIRYVDLFDAEALIWMLFSVVKCVLQPTVSLSLWHLTQLILTHTHIYWHHSIEQVDKLNVDCSILQKRSTKFHAMSWLNAKQFQFNYIDRSVRASFITRNIDVINGVPLFDIFRKIIRLCGHIIH